MSTSNVAQYTAAEMEEIVQWEFMVDTSEHTGLNHNVQHLSRLALAYRVGRRLRRNVPDLPAYQRCEKGHQERLDGNYVVVPPLTRAEDVQAKRENEEIPDADAHF